jgi:hypothetical protein
MSYNNFLQTNQIYSYLFEVDFGNGWENWTASLYDIVITQEPYTDAIAGILRREIEARLIVEQADKKWIKANIKVRCYITSNNFQTLLFDGLTVGNRSMATNEVVLKIIDKTDNKLHTEFGTYATDHFLDNDGTFLYEGTNEEGGTVSNTNYRPKPLPPNFLPNEVACYLKFNINSAGEPGLYTCDQMLKAMGIFGGFDESGVFKIKKRVWTTPTHQWDVRDIQIYSSFKQVELSTDYAFNSIDVVGNQFSGVSVNVHLFINFGKTSKEITNVEVEPNSVKDIFIDDETFKDIYFGYRDVNNYFRSAYHNVLGRVEDTDSAPGVYDFYCTPRAYNNVPFFNGSNRFGETSGGFDFIDTFVGNFGNFMVQCWLRPLSTSEPYQMIVTNRNTIPRGQGVRIDVANRSIQFVNHGIEAVSSSNNFFDWNEAFNLLVIVKGFEKKVEFYKNGTFINSATYTQNLVASNDKLRVGYFPYSNNYYYHGRLQELRIYFVFYDPNDPVIWRLHNRAYITGQTFTGANEGLKGYWRFDEPNGTSNVVNYVSGGDNITLNFNVRSTADLFNRLRAWGNSSNLSFLSTYSNDDFKQSIKMQLRNESNTKAYLKRAYIMSHGTYQKKLEIRQNAKNVNTGEIEYKKEFKSFYINDGSYAQTLANNLLSVYNNEHGFFEFEILIQPRMMVGDIIRFNHYENGQIKDSIGVVLTIISTVSKNKLTSKIKVKKLRDT